MLNLSRRIGETIVIGDDVTVTVLAVKGKQVRLGFAAPEGVVILREEIAPVGEDEADDGSGRPS